MTGGRCCLLRPECRGAGRRYDREQSDDLEEAALHAEVMMRQEVGDQSAGGCQFEQALQHFQEFDDLPVRKRAITLMETLEEMAETARCVEEQRRLQVPDGRLKRAGPVVDLGRLLLGCLRVSHTQGGFKFAGPSNGQLLPFPPSTPIPPPPSFMLRA